MLLKECFYYVLIRAHCGSNVAHFIAVFAVVPGQFVIIVRFFEETLAHLALVLIGVTVFFFAVVVESLADFVLGVKIFLLSDLKLFIEVVLLVVLALFGHVGVAANFLHTFDRLLLLVLILVVSEHQD